MANKNIELFSIELGDYLPTYQTGPTVSGVVNVHLKDSISLTGIYINLQGKAEVSWSKHTYSLEEVEVNDFANLFDYKVSLPATEGIVKLGPGKFSYPFSIALPLDLPSSLEGEFGHIRYTCFASIARPWRPDPRCQTCFTVLEMTDLNKIPDVESPLTMSQTNTISEGVGYISGTMTLKKQGYVPGEHICIQADLDNQTGHKVRRATVSLTRIFHYKSGVRKFSEKRSIAKVNFEQIAPGKSGHWADESMLIPPIPPSRSPLTKCSLMSIEYFVQLKADLSKVMNAGLEINMPITIGSIPLMSDFSTFKPSAAAQTSPTTSATGVLAPSSLDAASAPPYSPSLLSQYPDLPPPSYEECVYGPVSISDVGQKHTQGNINYTPRYMYFNQEHLQAATLSSSGAQSDHGSTQP